MERLLEAADETYDLVVIDTSPVGVISDPIPLFDQVDGVLLVARMGEATRDSLTRLKRQLDNVNAPIVGIVANRVSHGRGQAAYAYYGDHEGRGVAGLAGAASSVRRRRRRLPELGLAAAGPLVLVVAGVSRLGDRQRARALSRGARPRAHAVLALTALRWPNAAILAVLSSFPLLGLIRRLLISSTGWPETDPAAPDRAGRSRWSCSPRPTCSSPVRSHPT